MSWAHHRSRLEAIGVGPRMLAAIRSLYSGALFMRAGGTAGPPLLQQNGVRQGCPGSPTPFGIFFDDLHGHSDLLGFRWAQEDGWPPWCMLMMLCCYLGRPPDSKPFWLHSFCQALGLTISPSTTEVVVLASMAQLLAHGILGSMCCPSLPPSGTWASCSMSLAAYRQLLQKWQGCNSPFERQAQGFHKQQVFDEAPV